DAQCRLYAVSLSGPGYRSDPASGGGAAQCPSLPSSTGGVAGGAGGTLPGAAGGGTSSAPADRTPPRVSFLGMLLRRFAVSSQPTAIVAAVRPPRGTVFRFALSERANVAIRIDRLLP